MRGGAMDRAERGKTFKQAKVWLLAAMLALMAACNSGGDSNGSGNGAGDDNIGVAPAAGGELISDPPPLSGGSGDTTGGSPTLNGGVQNTLLKLTATASCEDYKNYLTESLFKMYTQPVVITAGGVVVDASTTGMPAPTPAPAPTPGGGASASTGSSAAPTGVSGTNNQEAGVDEADIVKTDSQGNFYIIHNSLLIIARGYPPSKLQELGRLDLQTGGRVTLFLDEAGKRLLILDDQPRYIMLGDLAPGPLPPMPVKGWNSRLLFVDISEPAKPQVRKAMTFDGSLLHARMVQQRVHLVSRFNTPPPAALSTAEFQALLQKYFTLLQNPPSADNDPQLAVALKAIHDYIAAAVQATPDGELLPHLVLEENGLSTLLPVVECAAIDKPQVIVGSGLQVLSSLDIDGANLQSLAVTGNAWQFYASDNNVYLAQPSGGFWLLGGDEVPPHTAIQKFAISKDAPRYLATGAVAGFSHDQFSFSEYADHLRVVTTETRYDKSSGQTSIGNNLFVLGDDGQGNLPVSGAVRDFGKQETVFSSRFFGGKGYVVTFRRVDPLFTFDLSDPAAPKLVGEVEIPGFSTYMHPLGEDHLLTIGQAADSNGRVTGLQLQIFDVSDLAKPTLESSYQPPVPGGYSWSPALYDHLAFTYYEPAHLLVIPFSYWSINGSDAFNGFALFKAQAGGGIDDLGRIDHADLAYQQLCSSSTAADYSYYCTQNNYPWMVNPQRAIILADADGNYVYTLSNAGLKANDAADVKKTLASLVFPP